MALACMVTQIVNNTEHVLEMKVGNSLYLVDLTRLPKGGQYSMQVDYTDTYQEYMFHVSGSTSPVLVVTSDDCCDCKCITIKESVEGKFELQKEPRVRRRRSLVDHESDPVPKRQCSGIASWRFWIGLNIF